MALIQALGSRTLRWLHSLGHAAYFFADLCSNDIWSFRYQGAPIGTATSRTSELAPRGGLSIIAISSFGEDASGELYVCDLVGDVFKIVPGAIDDLRFYSWALDAEDVSALVLDSSR